MTLNQFDVDILRQAAQKSKFLGASSVDVSPTFLLELLDRWEDHEGEVQDAVLQAYEEKDIEVRERDDELSRLDSLLAEKADRILELESHIAAMSGEAA